MSELSQVLVIGVPGVDERIITVAHRWAIGQFSQCFDTIVGDLLKIHLVSLKYRMTRTV